MKHFKQIFIKKYWTNSTNTTNDTFQHKLDPWENLKSETKISAVCDRIAAEMIKHAPKTANQKIGSIFKNIVKTADVPENYPK